ncbi:MAG TPA: hypothetical protein VFL13_05395 [Candidatus Baltobacteraceae bacterium]|nr:hypothetical protein [Candidatus Baltobacteraceae bacterium]
MRLAVTCNGPGETAGWLTPLLHSLYAQRPDAQVYVFFVPDDYATGAEAGYIRSIFPQATVYDPRAYLKAALGGRLEGLPEGADVVLYLGGDLMHAARLHKRFGGALATYKFSRPRIAKETARAFSVDEKNERELESWGVPRERITRIGNLAIDGALAQAADERAREQTFDTIFMPGSRGHEVEHLVPFFFTAAVRMLREQPGLRVAFGISPFTDLSAIARAVKAGGDPRVFAQAGALEDAGGTPALVTLDGSVRIPVVRNAIAAARRSKLAVTIPGTKVIELAALGTPVLSCTVMNAPELITINGPLTYLDRIPVAGAALKRAVVLKYAERFTYHTQPNIDAQQPLIAELHGTLTPGRVARVALEMLADEHALATQAQALAGLYREHIGASVRMAAGLLALQPAG